MAVEQRETFVVHGLGEFLTACKLAPKELQREVRSILRDAAEVVRRAAQKDFEPFSDKSAHGYRTVVRTRGISVEQSIGKTTGTRPDFGALQMRKALIPALEEEEPRFKAELDHAVDLIRDVFEWQSY